MHNIFNLRLKQLDLQTLNGYSKHSNACVVHSCTLC